MIKRNNDIREAKEKIPVWLIAERLGVHENTFYHWMRKEMTPQRKQEILSIIEDLRKELLEGGPDNG